MLSWNAPLLLERTSAAQAVISSGCISSTPHDPSPPALATAIDNEGALAPAMGASRIGTLNPNRAQNASARSIVALIGSSPFRHVDDLSGPMPSNQPRPFRFLPCRGVIDCIMPGGRKQAPVGIFGQAAPAPRRCRFDA
jgi:hypothetical protein